MLEVSKTRNYRENKALVKITVREKIKRAEKFYMKPSAKSIYKALLERSLKKNKERRDSYLQSKEWWWVFVKSNEGIREVWKKVKNEGRGQFSIKKNSGFE